MRAPPQMRQEHDVAAGLERYETPINKYVIAGGSAPSDEKADVIMTGLPQSTTDRMMLSDFHS